MEMLVLPLVVMGVISVIGGLAGLRLPETLHHKLPQTVEEGEEFGKDFSMNDCLRCIPLSRYYGIIKIFLFWYYIWWGFLTSKINDQIINCKSEIFKKQLHIKFRLRIQLIVYTYNNVLTAVPTDKGLMKIWASSCRICKDWLKQWPTSQRIRRQLVLKSRQKTLLLVAEARVLEGA